MERQELHLKNSERTFQWQYRAETLHIRRNKVDGTPKSHVAKYEGVRFKSLPEADLPPYHQPPLLI